jgi:WD40 repeat protein
MEFDDSFACLITRTEWPASWRPSAPTLAFFNRRWKLEGRIAGLLDTRRRSGVRPRRPLVLVAAMAIGAFALASADWRLIQASDKPAATEGSRPAQETATDLPGQARVQLGGSRFRTEASDLAFLPDGKTIVSASWRQGLKYWDLASGRVRLRVRASADRMRMSADHQRLVTQDTYDREHTSLQVFDAADGKSIAKINWPSPDIFPVILQAVTNDGTAAILSDREGRVSIRDLATGRVLKERAISPREVEHVAVSPSSALLAIATDSNELFLWEWRSENPPVGLGPRRRYLGLAFSADGKRLAAGGDSKDDVLVFNVATQEIERSLTDPKGSPLLVDDLAFTPDGKRLAAANWIGLIHDFAAGILVWDVETGTLKHRFAVLGAQPKRLALSADGKLLAAPMGETLRVWSLETGQSIGGETTGHTAAVCALAFSPKGDRIVTASDDGTARIWNAVTGRELRWLDHGGRFVRATAISPDGRLVATSGLDDRVCIWRMETGKRVHALEGHGLLGGWRALQFSPDGSVLYSWGDDNNLRVWDVATGRLKQAFALKRSGTHDSDPDREKKPQRFRLGRFEEQCNGGCFRNGGKQLVLAARGGRYWIFDTSTGLEVGTQLPKVPLTGFVCSETGDRILVSSMARFRQRRLPSGGWTNEPAGPASLTLVGLDGSPVWSITVNGTRSDPIAVSPDGRLVAAGIGGPVFASIGIFDGNTGSLLKTIEGADPLQGIDREAIFSPDGNRLAIAQRDGTVLIWDLVRPGLQPNP